MPDDFRADTPPPEAPEIPGLWQGVLGGVRTREPEKKPPEGITTADVRKAFLEQASQPKVINAHPGMAALNETSLDRIDEPKFKGDAAIREYRQHVGAMYQDRLKDLGMPPDPEGQTQLEDALHRNVQQYALQNLAGRMQDEGKVARYSPGYIAKKIPFLSKAGTAADLMKDQDAAEGFGTRMADGRDYIHQAGKIAEQQRASQRGTGGKIFDAFAGTVPAVGEFMTAGGTASLGDTAGLGAADRAASMAAGTALQQAPNIATRSALGVAQRRQQGEDWAPAVAKELLGNTVSEGIMGGAGVLAPKAMPKELLDKVTGFAGHVVNGMLAGEADQDIQKAVGIAPEWGPGIRYLAAKTPEERRRAAEDILSSFVSMGAIQAGMHALGHLESQGHKVDMPEFGKAVAETAIEEHANAQAPEAPVPPPANAPAGQEGAQQVPRPSEAAPERGPQAEAPPGRAEPVPGAEGDAGSPAGTAEAQPGPQAAGQPEPAGTPAVSPGAERVLSKGTVEQSTVLDQQRAENELRTPGQPGPSKQGPPPPPVSKFKDIGAPPSGLWDGFKKVFLPFSRGNEAVREGGVIHREERSEQRRDDARMNAALGGLHGWADDHINGAPDEATKRQRFLDIQNAREGAGDERRMLGPVARLPKEALEYEKAYRPLQEEKVNMAVNRGLINPQNVIENYVAHLVEKDDGSPANPGELDRAIRQRRPLAGSEGFRKERVFPTWQEVVDAGYRPKGNNWNIVDLDMAKLHEVSKSIRAYDEMEALKKPGLNVWVGLGDKVPEGWREMQDPKAKTFAPPERQVTEFVDKQQTEALEGLATKLGIKVKTSTTGPAGLSSGDDITRRFAAPPDHVLPHEIGHWIDGQYPQLRQQLFADPKASAELMALADLRASGQVSAAYRDYLHDPGEQVANLLAAQVHAPDLLHSTAPTAEAMLQSFLRGNKDLTPLLDMKPSMELSARNQTLRLAGPQLTGRWVMPSQIADILDNYLSTGWGSNALGAAMLGVKNASAQMLLSASGFHATFTLGTSLANGVSHAIEHASRGNMGTALMTPLRENPVADFIKGMPLLSEYYKPGSGDPDTQKMVIDMVKAGWTPDVDPSEWGGATKGLKKSLNEMRFAMRRGEIPSASPAVKAVFQGVGSMAEMLSYPTLKKLVPIMKASAASRAVQGAIDNLPPGATDLQRTAAMQKAYASIEDRMGQMNYDNIGWSNNVKNAAQFLTLSPSWNFGTARVLGGGIKDIPASVKGVLTGKGMTGRTAFLMGLVGTSAAIGGGLNYLMTGEWPKETKDFFWPRDGTFKADGTPNRLRLPGYQNDIIGAVLPFAQDPVEGVKNLAEMGQNKIWGPLKIPGELAKNEDYYGNPIYDEKAGGGKKTAEVLGQILKDSLEPIGVKQAAQSISQGRGVGGIAMGAMGIGPAPSSITRTPEAQQAMKARSTFSRGLREMKEAGIKPGAKKRLPVAP